MLVLNLIENEIVNGNVEASKLLSTSLGITTIPENNDELIKLFNSKLEKLNILSETDDIPYVEELSEVKASCYQDIYYETNDDGEEVTIQIKLIITNL